MNLIYYKSKWWDSNVLVGDKMVQEVKDYILNWNCTINTSTRHDYNNDV